MELRTAALALALAAFGADTTAQQPDRPAPAQDPAPTQGQGQGQDPDRPSKTPEQRRQELQQEKQQLQREIEFVRERVANSKALIRDKLHDRSLEVRSIDAGTNTVAPMINSPMRKPATLLTAEQRAALGEDVLLVVEGQPVRNSDLESLVGYLEAAGTSPADDVRNQRAMLELVRIESAIGAFRESAEEAEQQIEAAKAEIEAGKDFAQVAQKYSRGPLIEDAKVTFTRNSPFGLFVEKAVFATDEGAMTPVVRGMTGYCLVHVDKRTKGEQPIADTAEGRIIVIPYHPDPTELEQVRQRVALGQVGFQLRDAAVVNLLPVIMRPAKVEGQLPKADVEDADPIKQLEPDKVPGKAPAKAGAAPDKQAAGKGSDG